MAKKYDDKFDFGGLLRSVMGGIKSLDDKLSSIGQPDIISPLPKEDSTSPVNKSVSAMTDGVGGVGDLLMPKAAQPAKAEENDTGGMDSLSKQIPEAKDILPHLAKALQGEGILTPETLAYALGTVKHETADAMKPVREGYQYDSVNGGDGSTGKLMAKKNGYSGGDNYYGRGLIQLTHDYNYKKYGDEIGVDLVKNPDLMLDPDISSKVLAKFFKDHNIADDIAKGDYKSARGAVNPDANADTVKSYSDEYLKKINGLNKGKATGNK